MPELPEIEHLRRTLSPILTGATICDVRLVRRDIATASHAGRVRGGDLLRGQSVIALHRHGKQLAIEGDGGGVLCIHLGMSGQLFYLDTGQRTPRSDHVHCIWRVARSTAGVGRLIFRDPRRFGGLWTLESVEELRRTRWGRLGPDALSLTAVALTRILAGRTRPLKSLLLDQGCIAGLGNIYVDEALFAARIHPERPSDELSQTEISTLTREIRRVLRAALRSGGSTLRDYVDASGREGSFTYEHLVYGRSGHACPRCKRPLSQTTVSQRTTSFCATCQT